VNGFSNKAVIVGKKDAEAEATAGERRVNVIMDSHRLMIADNGSGMNAQTLSRMFVPKQGSKQTKPLSGQAAAAELDKVKMVEDKTLPHRMSFSRNGEVIVAVDIPKELSGRATVPGGLMLEFGRLMDVPESRDKLNIPSGLDSEEEPNFQRAVMHAVRQIAAHGGLSAADKMKYVNTLAVGLKGLTAGNAHYEHAVNVLLAEIKKEMAPTVKALVKAGHILLPHEQHYEKLYPGRKRQNKVVYLHEQIFDWQGEYSLRAIGGRVIPGITLAGEKGLPLVVVPFKAAWVGQVARFRQEWHTWKEGDRLPMIKTDRFIAIPEELGGRLHELALKQAADGLSPAEAEAYRKEFAMLAEAVNIMTAEKVVTHYEVGETETNIVAWKPQFAQSEGEIDSRAVNRFLAQLPAEAQGLRSAQAAPQDANLKAVRLSDGRVVEVGSGRLLAEGVRAMEPLPHGYLKLTYDDRVEVRNPANPQAAGVAARTAKPGDPGQDLVLSPDRRYIMAVGKDSLRIESPIVDLQQGMEISIVNSAAKKPGTALMAPQFSGDGRFLTALVLEQGSMSLWVKDLLNPDTANFEESHFKLADGRFSVAAFRASEWSHWAYLEADGVKYLIDLEQGNVVAKGKDLIFHTDSSGAYTAVVDQATGKMRVHLQSSATLYEVEGKPIKVVTTVWNPALDHPRLSLVAEDDTTYEFNGLGVIRRSTARGSHQAVVESMDRDGVVAFSYPWAGSHHHEQYRPDSLHRREAAAIYYNPKFKLVIDRLNPSRAPQAVDPANGQHFTYSGRVIGYDQVLNRLHFHDETQTQILKYGEFQAAKIQGVYRVLDGKHQDITKPIAAEFRDLHFDGKYMVFANPDTGEVIYLNPQDPQHRQQVALGALLGGAETRAPPDAKLHYALNRQGEVVDLLTGQPVAGISGAKSMSYYNHGYYEVETDQGRMLVNPGRPQEAIEIFRADTQATPDRRFFCKVNISGQMPDSHLHDLKTGKTISIHKLLGLPEGPAINLFKPRFSQDGRFLTVLIHESGRSMFASIDLTAASGPELVSTCSLDTLLENQAGSFLKLEYLPHPHAPVAYIRNPDTGLMSLVDLRRKRNPMVMDAWASRLHTDSTGAYVAAWSPDHSSILYLLDAQKVMTDQDFGDSFIGVNTDFGANGQVAHEVILDDTRSIYFDRQGNLMGDRAPFQREALETLTLTGFLYASAGQAEAEFRLDDLERPDRQELIYDAEAGLYRYTDPSGIHKMFSRQGREFSTRGSMVYYNAQVGFIHSVDADRNFLVSTESETDKAFRPDAKFVALDKPQPGNILFTYRNAAGRLTLALLDNQARNVYALALPVHFDDVEFAGRACVAP